MSVRFAAATREAARLFSPQHCHLNPFGGTVTRITRTFWFRFLALAVGLAIVSFGVACSGDDDDSTDETRDDVETEAESQEDDDDAADSDDDDSGDGDIETSPSDGEEYLGVYTDIADDLEGNFAEECVDAIDIDDLDFSDAELPEECEDYFDEFASRLDEVEPPDSCADLHELLLGVLNSLAAGESDAFEDLLGGGDDDQPSEGIISASVDCSGI